MSERERSRAKFLARQAEQRAEQLAKGGAGRRRTSSGERQASRAEQYGRYLDAGPQHWDDRNDYQGA